MIEINDKLVYNALRQFYNKSHLPIHTYYYHTRLFIRPSFIHDPFYNHFDHLLFMTFSVTEPASDVHSIITSNLFHM